MSRWILRYAIALAFAGGLAVLIVSPGSTSVPLGRSTGSSSSGSSTSASPPPTTEPSIFPALPTDGTRALRTGTNLVLPVLGGEPDAWVVRTPCAAEATIGGAPLSGAHLVLDPGHGGTETGAIGPSGLTEASVNLDVAFRTAQRLEGLGASVVMTRSSDVRVTLQTRAEIAIALDPIAFISIHHNAVPRTTRSTPGSELYHQLDSPESQRLAGLLWEEYQEELAPLGTVWGVSDQPGALARQSARTGGDFYGVLRRSVGVPAVLSEAAYLSEPAEDALLNSDVFRDAEAKAISDAFVRFVTTDDPGSGFGPAKVVDTPSGGGGGTTGCEDPPLG